jgi:hypothetical protein
MLLSVYTTRAPLRISQRSMLPRHENSVDGVDHSVLTLPLVTLASNCCPLTLGTNIVFTAMDGPCPSKATKDGTREGFFNFYPIIVYCFIFQGNLLWRAVLP